MVDPENTYRWLAVSGTAELTTDGADAQIDKLAKKYLGQDEYPWRNPEEERITVRIQPEQARRRPASTNSLALTLCDVGPRDGLQNEAETLEPAARAELVNRLAAAGLPRVEAASFVRADARAADGGRRGGGRGDRAPRRHRVLRARPERARATSGFAAAGLDRVNVTLGATESFNQRNGERCRATRRWRRSRRSSPRATEPATVTISVAFGCPFEGEVDAGEVVGACGAA